MFGRASRAAFAQWQRRASGFAPAVCMVGPRNSTTWAYGSAAAAAGALGVAAFVASPKDGRSQVGCFFGGSKKG
eukprot:CAMPEP_0117511812 /NCGR_PEP_ID=MMETSP0784-20121206/28702_1 /TAXON_ID=39447 /ORGANISM="" /LENGTH=73 /DNA_ID=CAMNT_0005307499 /DNA_START=74 /DNA_END=292 /DNA_ORIENTATION=-